MNAITHLSAPLLEAAVILLAPSLAVVQKDINLGWMTTCAEMSMNVLKIPFFVLEGSVKIHLEALSANVWMDGPLTMILQPALITEYYLAMKNSDLVIV